MLKGVEYLAIGSAIVFAVCLVALIVFYASPDHPSIAPPSPQASEKHEPVKEQREAEKPFWSKATTDPVAAFTLFLVLFTTLLAGVGAFQLKMLGRSETIAENTAQSARQSAQAAQKAVEATERTANIQRAWVFAGSGLTHLLRDGKDGREGNDVPSPNGHPQAMVYPDYRNYGASPAFVEYVFIDLWPSGKPLPKEPQYKTRYEIMNPQEPHQTATVKIRTENKEQQIFQPIELAEPTYIYGRVYYRDVFDKVRRHSSFIYLLRKDGRAVRPLTVKDDPDNGVPEAYLAWD